jgi:hypothetical protein
MTPRTAPLRQLVQQYEQGRITATGLILEVLSHPGKQRLAEILEALPQDILEQLKEFVENYEPGMKVFRGPRPNAKALATVKEWFGCRS